MNTKRSRPKIDLSLEEIERAILPNAALLLDCLLDAAETARAGAVGSSHAGEIRILAGHVRELTHQIERATAVQLPEPVRMSA